MLKPTNKTSTSKKNESYVEEIALKKFGYKLIYPSEEKIGVIVVPSFPELGTFTALRFIEWVQNNPGGVISLPTGKTPEYFIKEVKRFLQNWNSKDTSEELSSWGIDPTKKPDMGSLHFVQIDEFYPINPSQQNSFYFYVKKFYIKGFGLDPGKAQLINCNDIGLPDGMGLNDVWPNGSVDITLRYRKPTTKLEIIQKDVIERVDQWCSEYEENIRKKGGIGFFLGGIGPDGHIGFNIRGSDLNSTTRLTPTNYETQAAAALDLGGIEVARKRLVITIGLSTITYNPECTAIIIAAGEAKAKIVAESIRNSRHVHYPATALQNLKNSRFYLTTGAAKLLNTRQLILLQRKNKISDEEIEKIIIDISLKEKKSIETLTKKDFIKNEFGNLLLKKEKIDIEAVKEKTINSLKQKISRGSTTLKNVVFLHSEPHHDDVMLGYLPAVVRHIREHSTKHYFCTLTSGFTSVTNNFMLQRLTSLKEKLQQGIFHDLLKTDYFSPDNTVGKNRDVWQYLDGVAANSESMKEEGHLRRLLRNLIYLYEEIDTTQLIDRIDELIIYFKTQYPGRKDLPHIQKLKGMVREWEADCLWGYFGWHTQSIFHLRLGFYTGDIFTEEPTVERDVLPIVRVFEKIKPDIITVALDPEASGPDTHYKVLQAITQALKLYEKSNNKASKIKIWGYRNVWYRFHPSEANIYVPVSLNMFALQDNSFKNAFLTQKDASFPSYEHDGPFSELAQKIQVEQYNMLKTCLGRSFFYEHPSALIRATRGMVFIKEMSLEDFYTHSREIKRKTENL